LLESKHKKHDRGEKIKMRLFGKNKKAFSAVIASLILMLLAVAAGVVVYAYVMGWIGSAQQSSTNTGMLQVDSITASGSTIKLYVRNVGGVDVTLDKIYVAGTSVRNSTSFTSNSAKLPVQSTAYLQIGGQSLTANRFYEVKVVCLDGTQISTTVEAK
jgi:hypothetical protein